MEKEKSLLQTIANLTNIIIDKCYKNNIPILIAYQEPNNITESHALIKDITDPRFYTALDIIKDGDPGWNFIQTTSSKKYNKTVREFKELLLKIKLLIESEQYDKLNLILAEIDVVLEKEYNIDQNSSQTISVFDEDNDGDKRNT